MNFKNLIFLFTFLFIYTGCGVKGPPKAPAGTEITPWVKNYLSVDASSDEKTVY